MSHAIDRSRTTQRAFIGRVLVQMVSGDGVEPAELGPLVRGRDLTGVVEAARYHRVVGWAYRALRDVPEVDPDVVGRLRDLHRASARNHLRVTVALTTIAAALDEAGLRWLVFKGPVLSECVYRAPELRLYRDLDLLVARTDFATSLRVLQGVGATLLDHNWPLIRRDGYGELNLTDRFGTALDLHWQLLFSQELRDAFPIPVDEVIERADTVIVRGRSVRTLDPADTLMHLAFHAALAGGDRLIWLKDLEQSIRHREPDWDLVVHRSRAWRVQILVALMLERAQRTVDARVPDGIVEALTPQRPWRVATAGLDRLFPSVHSRGGGNPARMVARTARGSPAASAGNLGSVLGKRVLRLVRERRWDLPETEDDPSNPESVRYPAGAPGDLERYLEHVQRG
ncbi:MAG TPA: nucleotidyltransferase family protein [Acidimicrobiales bacterium]|nr:nucleotidyltransferase family protein [Acidimicrobiales bacterium]